MHCVMLVGKQYHFRRRVPAALVEVIGLKEIYRTLGTSCRRKANERAAILFIETERIFRMAHEALDQVEEIDLPAEIKEALSDKAWADRAIIDEINALRPKAWR